MNKLLERFWKLIEFILVLLLWPAIVFMCVVLSIFLGISSEVILEKVVGIFLVLVGIYVICKIRPLFEKCNILSILFGWLGPLCTIFVGFSLILN